MTRHLRLALALTLATAAGCSPARDESSPPSPAPAATPEAPARDTSGLDEAIDGMDAVLRAYLGQAELLAKDTHDPSSGEALATAIGEVAIEPAPEWLDELSEASATYLEAGDIKTARMAFSELSGPVVAYVDAHKSSVEMHKVRCPMAPEGIEGTWLQAGAEVENPWYGSKMLRCGVKIW